MYQGEELGMTNFPFSSIEDVQDIEARGHYEQAVALGAGDRLCLDGIGLDVPLADAYATSGL